MRETTWARGAGGRGEAVVVAVPRQKLSSHPAAVSVAVGMRLSASCCTTVASVTKLSPMDMTRSQVQTNICMFSMFSFIVNMRNTPDVRGYVKNSGGLEGLTGAVHHP